MFEVNVTNDDETRANLLFLGIIGLYFFLVLVAFLFTEGRKHYIVPLLREWWPTHSWVRQVDIQAQQSVTDEDYRHLNLVIRKAKRDGIIHRWKVRNGVNYVQVYEDDHFVEVLDTNGLGLLGLKILQESD